MARRGRDNPHDIENAAGEAVWDDAEEAAEAAITSLRAVLRTAWAARFSLTLRRRFTD